MFKSHTHTHTYIYEWYFRFGRDRIGARNSYCPINCWESYPVPGKIIHKKQQWQSSNRLGLPWGSAFRGNKHKHKQTKHGRWGKQSLISKLNLQSVHIPLAPLPPLGQATLISLWIVAPAAKGSLLFFQTCACMHAKSLQSLCDPLTTACQAPLPKGFSR